MSQRSYVTEELGHVADLFPLASGKIYVRIVNKTLIQTICICIKVYQAYE